LGTEATVVAEPSRETGLDMSCFRAVGADIASLVREVLDGKMSTARASGTALKQRSDASNLSQISNGSNAIH